MENKLCWLNLSEMACIPMLPGAKARFVHSGSMTLARWDLDAGASIAEHSHPHEQIMHLIDGSFEMTAGGRTAILEAGSILVIPPNVPHSGKALAACRVIDVFYPVREDFCRKQEEYDSKTKERG